MGDSLKEKIVHGVLWQGIERVGSLGISFVISIILARLLAPEEFGTIAILVVFINICDVFVNSGFSAALIQKKEIDDTDCSSVFYINIVMAVMLYLLLVVASPYIGGFYENVQLATYLKVLALVLVIRSFSLVQLAILNKRMRFELSFRITWCALIISGSIGIYFAYHGFGVWSLIFQQLVNAFVTAVLLWVLIKWRPKLVFNLKRIKTMFSYGGNLFFSNLIDVISNNLYELIIGKLFNLTTLSYYNMGRRVPNLGIDVINSTVGNVFFSALSHIQEDRERMKIIMQKSIKIIMFFTIPALGILMVGAEPLVRILLGEKWLPAVIYMQLCCLVFVWWPLHTQNLQVIKATGRSDIYLILEFIKKIQLVVAVLLTYRYGAVAMVTGLAVTGFFSFIENAWPNKKLINYSAWQQLFDLLPLFILGVFAGFLSHYASRVLTHDWLRLGAIVLTFSVVYLLGGFVFRLIPHDMINIIKNRKLI